MGGERHTGTDKGEVDKGESLSNENYTLAENLKKDRIIPPYQRNQNSPVFTAGDFHQTDSSEQPHANNEGSDTRQHSRDDQSSLASGVTIILPSRHKLLQDFIHNFGFTA